jgi:hypothetical protein
MLGQLEPQAYVTQIVLSNQSRVATAALRGDERFDLTEDAALDVIDSKYTSAHLRALSTSIL